MQETILSLQDVSYSYQTKAQTVHAVREVRYSFETGRFYAIMGRSGSGKTTLLSLMAGLELPDSGQVCYRETPTSQLDCDAYRRDKAAVIYRAPGRPLPPREASFPPWGSQKGSFAAFRLSSPAASSSGWPLPGR